jgi:hypothetical protein
MGIEPSWSVLEVLRRASALCLLGTFTLTCGAPEAPTNQGLSALTVCEALAQPVGKRIRVKGEFDGFGYDLGSTTFKILSTGTCTTDGAGIVWVDLWNASEADKASRLQPRRNRQQLPGDAVTVEGEVVAERDSRSIRLRNAIVLP